MISHASPWQGRLCLRTVGLRVPWALLCLTPLPRRARPTLLHTESLRPPPAPRSPASVSASSPRPLSPTSPKLTSLSLRGFSAPSDLAGARFPFRASPSWLPSHLDTGLAPSRSPPPRVIVWFYSIAVFTLATPNSKALALDVTVPPMALMSRSPPRMTSIALPQHPFSSPKKY